MLARNFIITSKTGALGLGAFPYHNWHKEEKKDVLKSVSVKVEYDEVLEEVDFRGTFRTASDKEHADIIRLYIEENLGMKDMAEKLNRSSRISLEHIHSHNDARASKPKLSGTEIERKCLLRARDSISIDFGISEKLI